MPALTVVCAFRDASAFLPDLLESLCAADLSDSELIFVDDASGDAPDQIISRYEPRLPSVTYERLDESRGPAFGRNVGMDRARGELIAFVDADDWVGPAYLSSMVEAMDAYDVDFIRTDQVRVHGRIRKIHRASDRRYYRCLDPRSAILPHDQPTMVDYPYSHSGMFRTSLIDAGLLKMPEHLRTAEDRLWIWNLHLHAGRYLRLPGHGYFYRRDVPTSLTQIGDDRQLDFIPSFQMIVDEIILNDQLVQFHQKAMRQMLAVIHHHATRSDRLTPELAAQMHDGICQLLRAVPEPALAAALDDFGDRSGVIRRFDRDLYRL